MHCILEATELPAPSSYANLWSQDAEGNYAIVKSAERITVSEFTRGMVITNAFHTLFTKRNNLTNIPHLSLLLIQLFCYKRYT